MTNYQLYIELKRSKPGIWRRILVPSGIYLTDFHKVIQLVMGWKDAHLYQFEAKGFYFLPKMEDDDFWNENINIDSREVKLSQVLDKEMDNITYEYDFGDGWKHIITLEKILPSEELWIQPVCLAGEMSCPPEDCGGMGGYADLLDAINNPKRSDRAELIEWLGGDFDPKYFDLAEVNEYLKSIKFRKTKT